MEAQVRLEVAPRVVLSAAKLLQSPVQVTSVLWRGSLGGHRRETVFEQGTSLEQLDCVHEQPSEPEIDHAEPHLRWKLRDEHATLRPRLYADDIALSEDTQSLIHRIRADAEPVDEVRAERQARTRLEPPLKDLPLEFSGDPFRD